MMFERGTTLPKAVGPPSYQIRLGYDYPGLTSQILTRLLLNCIASESLSLDSRKELN